MKHNISLIFTPILLLLTISCSTFSQTKILNGIVTDQRNEPIPFASVSVKNSSAVAESDENGKFQLNVPDTNVILIVRFLGFNTAEVKVAKGQSFVRLILEENVATLEEVIITDGLGSKHDRSKSIATHSVPEGVLSIAGSRSADIKSLPDKEMHTNPNATAGVLTAGEINDFGKWILWKDIGETDLNQWKDFWKIYPDKRYCVQVQTEQGNAIVDASAELKNSAGEVFWRSRTDNTGKAELWLNMFGRAVNTDNLIVSVTYNQKTYALEQAKEFHDGINILRIPDKCGAPQEVEIAFVVDATGSMQDEIDYLKKELNNIITDVKDSLESKQVNLGCVFYRDQGDSYVTKSSPLSGRIEQTINFIKANNADGGGDFPEAVDQALNAAINHLNWSTNACARIIFLILDAPPHEDASVKMQLQQLIKQASAKGIRIVPVTCSGIDKSTEYLLRSVALATNGTYIFLTDHSGVGNAHIAPTTDKYDVELLNDVISRVIYNFSHTDECISSPHEEIVSDTLMVTNPAFTDSLTGPGNETYNDSTISVIQSNSNEKFIRWKYYPNPTLGIVHVQIEGSINELFVMDISGKVILRYEVTDTNLISVDLSDFAAGTYFLMAEYAPDKRVSGKVVLVH